MNKWKNNWINTNVLMERQIKVDELMINKTGSAENKVKSL